MSEEEKKGLEQYADIRFLTADQVVLSKTNGGFLSLKIQPDENYENITLQRCFPLSHINQYISIMDHEGKEIGMIEDLVGFPDETVKLIEYDMNIRYFSPEIIKIHSIKEEFGYYYWHVETVAGEREFTIRAGSEHIKLLQNSVLIIQDVDGNRYTIQDYTKMDDKYVKILGSLI